MIEISKLDVEFIQNTGSCVLASYAIVGNYFSSLPVTQFFEDYCKHFNLSFSSWQEAEGMYANHFVREYDRRKCEGYQVILDLHNNSQQEVFKISRKIFSATFYPDSLSVVSNLKERLGNEESFLNVTFSVNEKACHSVTAFYDKENLMYRDTNRPRIFKIASLTELGKLRDSVLYSRIEQ